MNKNDFVGAVAEAAGLSKGQSLAVIECMLATITDALKKGEEVRLVGFGTFHVSTRAKSVGRNPRTGEQIALPSSKQPKFKAGKGLKDAVNG